MEEINSTHKKRLGKERLTTLIFIAIICAIFGFDLIFGKLLWAILILVELPLSLFFSRDWQRYLIGGIYLTIFFGIVIYIIAHRKDF